MRHNGNPSMATSPTRTGETVTMPDMTKPKHARLDAAWGLLSENPVLLAIAVIGFFVSFQTIAREAHAQHMPGWPQLYPLLFDALFLGFTIEGRKAIDDGRSDLVPRVLAWGAGAFTLYVNVHGSPAHDWLGIALHAAAPCAWIAFLELTRWRKLRRKRAERQDGIPLARWLAEPFRTLGMRKRMVVHNVTSYPVAVAREEARLLAIDLTRASLGRRWKHHAPAVLRHHLRNGTLPTPLAQACEMASYSQPAVAEPAEEWVTDALASRDRAVAKVRASKRAAEASVTVPGDASVAAAPVRQPARQNGVSVREQKRLKVVKLLTDDPALPRKDVAKRAGVSESTVDRVKATMPASLDEARQKRA